MIQRLEADRGRRPDQHGLSLQAGPCIEFMGAVESIEIVKVNRPQGGDLKKAQYQKPSAWPGAKWTSRKSSSITVPASNSPTGRPEWGESLFQTRPLNLMGRLLARRGH